jgi:hypothetical protein
VLFRKQDVGQSRRRSLSPQATDKSGAYYVPAICPLLRNDEILTRPTKSRHREWDGSIPKMADRNRIRVTTKNSYEDINDFVKKY